MLPPAVAHLGRIYPSSDVGFRIYGAEFVFPALKSLAFAPFQCSNAREYKARRPRSAAWFHLTAVNCGEVSAYSLSQSEVSVMPLVDKAVEVGAQLLEHSGLGEKAAEVLQGAAGRIMEEVGLARRTSLC